jgi:hypothetical protein
MYRKAPMRSMPNLITLAVFVASPLLLLAPRSISACECSDFAYDCICSYGVEAILEGTVTDAAAGDAYEAKMKIDSVIWPDDTPDPDIEARDDMPTVGDTVSIKGKSRKGRALEPGDFVLAPVSFDYSGTLSTTEFSANLVHEDGTVACEEQPQVTFPVEEARTALFSSQEECTQFLVDRGLQENDCTCGEPDAGCSTVAPGSLGLSSLIALLLAPTALWASRRKRKRINR